MASAVQKITLSSSRDIPLNKLILSQSNVRRVKAGVSIEDLAADIARRGCLLQSLNVRPVLDADGAETGMFEVPAGGRRFRALQLLVKQKRLTKTAPVPCVVRDPSTEILAEDDSLAENVQRAPLHPLDQFRAFQSLREKGLSDEEIAAAYFVSVNVVKQRLRLAAVSEKLLDIYAEDGMSLEQLMAFTVTTDHARQEQVWDALQRSYSQEPYQIRRVLTEKTVRASDKRVLFVGIDVYESAGGVVMRDLFQQDDGGWLENIGLLETLVTEKLKTEAETIAAEGWKWIEVAVEFPYGHDHGLRGLDGVPADLTEEERATREVLRTEFDQLEAQYQDADELPDEVDQRLGEIETALEAFEARPRIFDPTDVTRAGVFISIGHDGQLLVDRGYIRPEDEAPVIEPDQESDDEGSSATQTGTDTGTPAVQRAVITIGGQAEPEEDDDDAVKPLPDRLMSELTAHRTLALRDAVANNPHVAMTALLHKLCLDTFQHPAAGNCLEASVRQVYFSAQAADLKDSPSAKAVAERHEAWKADMPKDEAALWDWLATLDDASRAALLAHCVSFGVNALYEKGDRYGGPGVSIGPRESAGRLAPSRSPEAPFMNDLSPIAADQATQPSPVHRPDAPGAIIAAAQRLLPHLERGQRVDAAILRAAMEAAFGASDASGAWDWKTAYDACEAGTVLFLRKYGKALFRKADSPASRLSALTKIAGLLPTHTRRSAESEAFQQFSTPTPLGFAALTAAAIGPADRVLEPSAGIGLLAIMAEIAGGALALNELAETRSALLASLFPAVSVTRFDAAQIDDHLDPATVPSVVLMNPPFSAMANVAGRMADTAYRHIASALARLSDGGRLVAITGANFGPETPAWRDAFTRLQERGRVVFTAAIDGAIYAKHGTTIETRLTVIDREPAPDVAQFPRSAGVAPDVATLLGWIAEHVPPRRPIAATLPAPAGAPRTVRGYLARMAARQTAPVIAEPKGVELPYETVEWTPPEGASLTDALYEEYVLQSIRIPGSQAHPTKLVQSAAMASVAPPRPSYRPHLPANLVTDGLLSDAQLESVIYAGEAHGDFLAGAQDRGVDALAALDNWLKGRRRALWISKSDKLIEDAQRDWSALGMERLLVTPLSRFRQGTPIRLTEGILFTTYATLRTDERGEKLSRVRQIVEWLGSDFDGVIIFDESHAMQNAVGGKGERGDQAPSQQGRAGLRLQHALANARVVYVSATGATGVQNLAYAQRLGLWGGEDFPFATRAEFVEAIEDGGVAAMEVLARDLKALGLYAARSLSYEGVEYDLVEHQLTPEQIRIYDAYAGAFSIIHNNLDAAMQAANITSETGTLNAQAMAAARSAFESAKQRFFGHLLTSMKTPSLIGSIERDLTAGHATVIQIVSTGEALMERRLAEIPTEEWGDVQVDITPREYVLDYLAHSFPVQLYEPFTDSEGNLSSRSVYRDGQPVESREAVARRDRLIEKLASLPPVPGALDQIVQRFGTDMVAEVTGRSRRVIRKGDRLMVEKRAASANLAETAAFMDDAKRILVFSDAGGTGRSYHADLSARNRRLRIHYLLEPGWKADAAIQGLGRTNRTNQAQPPLFRPIATDVKAEKRFLSTIARRLDTLGAITRGQRQTGGQGLFRPEDNLESHYGRDALRQLYHLLVRGNVEGCSLQTFEASTGLKLMDANGIKDELPPITTFLNRLLALTIDLQNVLFTAFEQLLTARIEGAIASATYDVGLETLRAESFVITDRRAIYTHPGTGAETRLLTIIERRRNRPVTLDEALDRLSDPRAVLLINERSGRAAVQVPAPSLMLDDGEIERRVRLIRPMEHHSLPLKAMAESHWVETDREHFAAAWQAEIGEVPKFTDSTIHVVAGLLLPIWKRLPNESTRVYRLQTNAGERIIGRKVSPAWVATVLATDAPTLMPDTAFAALMEGRAIIDLAEGLQLRRVRVMGANRIELSGFNDTMRDRLKAYGLFHEIISWKLRMFVPTDASGVEILARVLDRYPVERIGKREAA